MSAVRFLLALAFLDCKGKLVSAVPEPDIRIHMSALIGSNWSGVTLSVSGPNDAIVFDESPSSTNNPKSAVLSNLESGYYVVSALFHNGIPESVDEDDLLCNVSSYCVLFIYTPLSPADPTM